MDGGRYFQSLSPCKFSSSAACFLLQSDSACRLIRQSTKVKKTDGQTGLVPATHFNPTQPPSIKGSKFCFHCSVSFVYNFEEQTNSSFQLMESQTLCPLNKLLLQLQKVNS